MSNKLVLASAGAGKTTKLVEYALKTALAGKSALILTYTKKNQTEIINKIYKKNGFIPKNICVNGWFSFLLKDMIRPYQRCLFKERISNINFDSRDPHKRIGRVTNINGRSEKINGKVNERHYLINNKVHTTYISKLATKICDKEKTGQGKSLRCAVIERLAAIYDLIVIDEVQDLVGWDYSVLEYILSNSSIELYCVGDFRQTVLQTSTANKKTPETSEQKIKWFESKKFERIDQNHSWRCIDPICKFADIVHQQKKFGTVQKYKPTVSKVTEIPKEFQHHIGVFTVTKKDVKEYLEEFKPMILRYNRTVQPEICEVYAALNFGEAKGLGFDRVLIIPTKPYREFLQGKTVALLDAKTEEGLNKLYVAITRAKFSVAFLYDGVPKISGIVPWKSDSIDQGDFFHLLVTP